METGQQLENALKQFALWLAVQRTDDTDVPAAIRCTARFAARLRARSWRGTARQERMTSPATEA